MNQSIDIKNIFEKINVSENSVGSILEKILVEFHPGIIKDINSNKEMINEYTNLNLADKENLTLNKNKYISIFFSNNFILLNEEIYKLFKSNFRHDFDYKKRIDYIAGDDRIFILIDDYPKNSVLVYKKNLIMIYFLQYSTHLKI